MASGSNEDLRAIAGKPMDRLGTMAAWAALLIPPFLVESTAKEAFRLPKLMASDWLGLFSLVCFAWGIRTAPRVNLADISSVPAVRAVMPFLAVATAGVWTTSHPEHFRASIGDLWIGAACLVGWSVALTFTMQLRLLRALIWPATVLSLLVIDQFHHLIGALDWLRVQETGRLALTSTAGNPADLALYLVLPALVTQSELVNAAGTRRWLLASALVICLYAMALTQTVAATGALAVASAVLWALTVPRRYTVLTLGAAMVAGLCAFAAVAPFRARVLEKVSQASGGDLNAVLTGRLDGWRAGAHMVASHPWTGAGQGGFRAEYVPAKLELLDQGAEFYREQHLVVLAHAHNEALHVAAELGVPGVIALGWALSVVWRAARRRAHDDPLAAPLVWSGLAGLAVLTTVQFPFHIALVAFPILVFLSWVLNWESVRDYAVQQA